MKRTIALLLGLACGSAMAAARIESVKARQSKPLEALITVSIERPTPLDQSCDAVVDPGDGAPQTLKYGVGDKRTKTLQHKYARAGTYKVTVKGSGKCEGLRETSVTVEGGSGKAAPAKAAKTSCPRGWSVAGDSVRDNRYTCHANPPSKPLSCAEGTKYFYEKGVIGCR
ncbi:MAG TPA: PKD domain-containing protein [Burkholderiales bacterium]